MNFNITELLGMSEKLQAFIPQIKKFLPDLVQKQIEYGKKQKLQKGEIILYSVMLNPQGKIFIYGNKFFIAQEPFQVGERKFDSGCIVGFEELFKVELTQYLDIIEKQGLMGLMGVIPIGDLAGILGGK